MRSSTNIVYLECFWGTCPILSKHFKVVKPLASANYSGFSPESNCKTQDVAIALLTTNLQSRLKAIFNIDLRTAQALLNRGFEYV